MKVLDFGLAKAIEPTASVSGAGMTNSPTITSPALMTGVGVLLGTAAYMAPEQVKARPADKRSDIWAFGCVLYEMLTGRRAFPGDDISDTLANVLKAEPDWAALPSAVPQRLRAFIGRCLTKDMRQRLQAIGEARIATEAISQGSEVEPQSTSHPAQHASGRTRLMWLSAVILVAVAITAGVAAGRRPVADGVRPIKLSIVLPTGICA